MGDVIRTDRFDGMPDDGQRVELRRKFARRPLSRRPCKAVELPPSRPWRR